MINTVFQLVDDMKISPSLKDTSINDNQIVVRPTQIALCNADSRYFFGERPKEIMKKKLPIALGHEAIGDVVYDPKGLIEPGTKVVLIPNIEYEKNSVVSSNYLRSSKFCSSSTHGFMQELVVHNRDAIVELPKKKDYVVEPILELISVAFHAVSRFVNKSHSVRDTVGVWGDGNLGYITALILNELYPQTKVIVFGKHKDKLERFAFADETYSIDEIPSGEFLDHAFECVGGRGSEDAINQIIDVIKPEGLVSLLGVSENKVNINTRMMLEKGLTVVGNSRSVKKDFENAVEFINNSNRVYNYLENLITLNIDINSIEDIYYSFNQFKTVDLGKIVLNWKI